MDKKKKKSPVLIVLLIFFIIFCGFYIANKTGYYESTVHNKAILTEEGIKDFENKISNGEEIDLDTNWIEERVDYSSKLSRLGDELTIKVEKTVASGMSKIYDVLKSLF